MMWWNEVCIKFSDKYLTNFFMFFYLRLTKQKNVRHQFGRRKMLESPSTNKSVITSKNATKLNQVVVDLITGVVKE